MGVNYTGNYMKNRSVFAALVLILLVHLNSRAAEKQYEVALGKYKAGTTTILDVVSAQSSLADARAERAKATQNWFTSLANLAYATGVME